MGRTNARDAADARLRPEDERMRYPRPNWADAHVYTVDVFLRFMAEHGYTLQRCRKQVEFKDVLETVSAATDRRRRANAEALHALMTRGS